VQRGLAAALTQAAIFGSLILTAAVGFGVASYMLLGDAALAFGAAERDLLSSLEPSECREWPLRFWCAKEAVAKALGEGMRRGPRALVVQSANTQSGVVDVSVADGEAIAACTMRAGDFVVATSAIAAHRGGSA